MKFDILKPQTTSGIGRKAIQENCMFPLVGEATIHDKLFVVADGEDGDGKGYVASESFCQTVSDYFFQQTCPDEPLEDQMLDEALLQAGTKMAQRSPESKGISFAMLYMHRHGCSAIHKGDARIYHIRPKEQAILYRSADTPQPFIPSANPQEAPVKAIITHVQYGDYFVLLTKGAHQMISDTKLMSIICEPVNDSTKLIRISKELKESSDNYSVSIIHVSGVMNEAMDEHLPDNEQALMAGIATLAGAKAAAETSGDKTRKTAPKPAEKPRQTPQPQRQHTDSRPETSRPATEEQKEDEGSGVPVVLITALLIVALAIGAWFWMRGTSKKKHDEEPAVEVKKDSTKKDTINIMKNEKPKALDLMEEKKDKDKDKEKEKEKEKEREREKEKKSEPDTTVVHTPTQDAIVTEPPVREEPTTPAPAKTEEFKSEVTPIQQPAEPGTVTPKPVIPEEEQ